MILVVGYSPEVSSDQPKGKRNHPQEEDTVIDQEIFRDCSFTVFALKNEQNVFYNSSISSNLTSLNHISE